MKREKQAITSLLTNRFEEGQKQRQAFVRQWYINMAYLVGFQWIYWNTITRRLELRYTPENKIRMVSNQILPGFVTAISKLSKNPPQFETGASSRDPQDIVSAMTARKIIKHYWRKLRLEEEADLFTAWLVMTGNAYLFVGWDKDAGKEIQLPITWDADMSNDPKFGQLVNPTTGMPYQDGDDIINPESGQPFTYRGHEGEPDIHVVSPFQVLLPKGTSRFEKSPWTMQCLELNKEDIAAIYGNKIANKVKYEIKEKDAPVEKSIFHRLQGVLGSALGGTSESDTKVTSRTTTVLKSWDKPKPGEGTGIHLISAGGEVLHKGTFEFEDLGYPLKHCYYHRIPGLPLGRGLIEDVIPLQKNYNKRLSQITEAINEIARPRILIPFGSQISPLGITKSAGEKIKYNPLAGGKPEYLATGDLPQSMFADLDNIKKDIQQIMGLHEVSHANVPASVRSGVAISFLQDTDDTRMGRITRRSELTWEDAGRHLLYVVKENALEPRLGKIIGEDSEIEVFWFKGSDIKDSVDIYVQAGSAFPQNQMLKQQFIKELTDSGIIPPDQALKLLEIAGITELRKGTALDIRVAKMENEVMKQGQPIQPDMFEDVQAHLEVHGNWLKANKFGQDPSYKIIYQHFMITLQMLQMAMGAMTQPQGGQQTQIPQQTGGGV